ncbi:MAG: xanthine dehydrogenase family protein molybdopterin-binding subunit, partial [Sphingobacteriaceae bacterium]
MEKTNTNLNRRAFLKASALVGGGLMIQFSALAKFGLAARGVDAGAATEWNEINGFIKITADNVIKLICPNPEFGQNVMTSLPMIVAEELDVDWKKVLVEMGPHDNAKLGPQFTGGSNSMRMYWKPLREAGATARNMLMQAAAQTWGVPVAEVTTKAAVLYHQKSGKTGKYGDFAAKAAAIPVPKSVKTKYVKTFNVVRHSQKNVEGAKIVSGKPLFGLDYKHEGMLIAMVEHPPAFGMKLKSFDAS